MTRACWFLAVLLLVHVGEDVMANTPDELPLPADQVMFMRENPGAAIGLPLGATKAYAIGRSLQRQGESEAALMYLHRANRIAPDSERIATAYARSLVDAGYIHDAARILGQLVAAHPRDLDQRRQYAQLLAQSGRAQMALEQVRELRAQGQTEPSLIKLEADLLGDLGRVDEAVEVYREAGRRDPDRTEDYILAAGLLLQRHDRIEEMAALLAAGLREDPESKEMRVALVRYLGFRGQNDEARQEALEGDKLRRRLGYSQRPECSLDLGRMLARQGDFLTAADVLREVREKGFVDRETDTQLARYLLVLDEVQEARDVLRKAVKRWPDDAECHFLLGETHSMLDDIELAYADLARAVAADPSMPLYRLSLLRLTVIHYGEDLGEENPSDEQLALQQATREHAARAAVTVHPQDSDGHITLGHTFRALGALDRACRHFEIAAEVKENRVQAMLQLAYCQQLADNLGGARKTLANLYTEYPDDPEVANSYGYFLAETVQDLELAERLVRQALQVEPDNSAFLDSLGWVMYQRGEYQEAFDWLTRAVNERQRPDAVILEHLGRTLAALGKHEAARDMLRQSLQAGGDRETIGPLMGDLERDR